MYSTQLRPDPATPRGKLWIGGVLQSPRDGISPFYGYNTPTQETYSFRTGRLADTDGIAEDDEALLEADSYSERFALLKEQSRKDKQSPYDTGHEFWTVAKQCIAPNYVLLGDAFGTPLRYEGPLLCDLQDVPTNPYGAVPAVNTAFYGPAAIRATIPTHPIVNTAVALAELKREGFPMVGKFLTQAPRGLRRDHHIVSSKAAKYTRVRGIAQPDPRRGLRQSSRTRRGPVDAAFQIGNTASDEYLAYEFGLRPLMSDVNKLAQAIAIGKQRLYELERDSGKLIHRRFSFPIERSSYEESPVSGTVSMAVPISGYENFFFNGSRGGIQRSYVTTTRTTWFSGAYTYYFQQGKSLAERTERIEQQINALFGQRLTPEALWNLAPWSWFADWNANIGTNISNATYLSADGLVMQYGYLMSTIQVDRTVTISGPSLKGQAKVPFTTIFRSTRKERVKASPYGFSQNPSDYNTRQKAILMALGITKAPGVPK